MIGARHSLDHVPELGKESRLQRLWTHLSFQLFRGSQMFVAEGGIYVRSRVLTRTVASSLERAGIRPNGNAYRRLTSILLLQPARGVDAVLVSAFGRFGNSVIQLGNAIKIAEFLGAKSIRYFRWDTIANSEIELPQFGLLAPIGPKNRRTISSPATLWRTEAWLSEGPLFVSSADNAPPWAKKLGEVLGLIREESDLKGEANLVVHLRSGDVFAKNPHPAYGQPPWAFYESVLRHHEWETITVVAEDDRSPCLSRINDWAASRDICFELVIAPLAETVKVLSGSSVIAASNGTFVAAIQFLDDTQRTFFCFGELIHPLLQSKGNLIFQVQDKDRHYTEEAMSNNWTNSDSQRKLMLEYPLRAVGKPERLATTI